MEKNSKGSEPEGDAPDREPPATAHEVSDVSVPDIAKFSVGLILVSLVSGLLMWWLFDYFSESAKPTGQSAPTVQRRDPLPPEPRLQGAPGHEIHPLEELKALRAAEDKLLQTYSLLSDRGDVARVPIDRALELILQRHKLPARPKKEPQADGIPSDFNSARTPGTEAR